MKKKEMKQIEEVLRKASLNDLLLTFWGLFELNKQNEDFMTVVKALLVETGALEVEGEE